MSSTPFVRIFLLIGLPLRCLSCESTTCMSGNHAVAEDENSLLQAKVQHGRSLGNSADDDDGEVDFVVTRDRLFTGSPGLDYRVSMSFGDKDPGGLLSQWGSTVRGVPIGDAWLKVGKRYLPMQVQGHRVLERATEYYAPSQFTAASLAPVASLARVGQLQQPEDVEVIDPEQEAPQEQEAIDSEATQQETTEQEVTEPEDDEQETSEADDVDEQEAVNLESTRPEATQPEGADEQEGSGMEVDISEENAPATPEPQPFDGVIVQFGVQFRSFPTLDFLSGTFTTSLALTQRWPTNADVPRDGANPWSPNLSVMNHDIGGIEVVSTSTHANQTEGMTTQVDYLVVRVRQSFELERFPFDQQILSVRVAPASPGSVNMKLVPMHIPEERILEPELVEGHGFYLASAVERGVDDESITLSTPARGVIEVTLDRHASAYISSLFFPALLLLGLCWCVFFVPVIDPSVAVPRLAVTTGAFVAMLFFTLHVEQLVPARFGRMWIDVFSENVGVLVFAAVAFNTLEQYVHSYMGRPLLASVLSFELRIFYPLLSAFVLGLCYFASGCESLSTTSAACRVSLAAGIFGYIGTAYRRALVGGEDKLRSPVITSPR